MMEIKVKINMIQELFIDDKWKSGKEEWNKIEKLKDEWKIFLEQIKFYSKNWKDSIFTIFSNEFELRWVDAS